MSGYLDSSGNDLDDRFAFYVSGAFAPVTGYLDLVGNDLNTRYAPYASGAIETLTRYLDLSRNDLNGRFQQFVLPNFPTQQTTSVAAGNVCVDMDGVNCVVSGHGGGYLYWSNNSCRTLNIAKIGGVTNQQFWGCVAISGANAIAMGRLTSTGTNTFFLSSDFGRTYTVTSASGQPTAAGSFVRAYINISGSIAVWGESESNYVHYSTNAGSTWTRSAWPIVPNPVYVNAIGIYGNNVYVCTAGSGFWYSTNGGQSFTQNTNYTSSQANCVTQIGTNIYVGTYQQIYKLTSPTATPTSPSQLNINGIWFIALAGCKTSTNGDFIIASMDNNTSYYSNNGTTLVSTAAAIGNAYKIVATSTRIVYGRGGALYWGKNAFIT